MITRTTATVEKGQLKLDQPVELPDHSRVNLVIEPVSESPQNPLVAWESLQRRARQRPIRSGGRHFTRDELHERH
jgi:hypothetical protein